MRPSREAEIPVMTLVSLADDGARDNRFGGKLTSYGVRRRAAERVTLLRQVTSKYFYRSDYDCGCMA